MTVFTPPASLSPAAAGGGEGDVSTTGAYLSRIGYGGSTEPTLETLSGVVLAHVRAVPFENLDIVPLARPLRLDQAGLFAKIVGERRGGFCFELNGALGFLLENLGFTVVRVGCQFTLEAGYSDPFDHLALIVAVPGGGEWFVDVGAGRTTPATPLEMPGPGAWGAPGPPDPADGTIARTERRGDAGYIWRQERGGAWQEFLRFSFTPRTLDEFLPRCRFFETDPDNYFRQGPGCSRLTETGRVSIRPGMLTITTDGERAETPLLDDAALHDALIAHFGIDLSRYGSAGEAAR
jgi:N-hydroxyarylamine O-acetyltransferase